MSALTELHALIDGWLASPHDDDDRDVLNAICAALSRAEAAETRLVDEAFAAGVAYAESSQGSAWAALPDSVVGDGAPASATLAERITAVVIERDHARNGLGACSRNRERLQRDVRSTAALVDLAAADLLRAYPRDRVTREITGRLEAIAARARDAR